MLLKILAVEHLHYEVELRLFWVIDDLVKTDNVGMVQFLHNFQLSNQAVLCLFVDLMTKLTAQDDFHCELLPLVGGELAEDNFALASDAQLFDDSVLVDQLSTIGASFGGHV